MARPRTDIRPRIIEAARARFLISGVDGAALREVARDAGTSLGMISYYFPSKDDLFLAVVDDVYEGIVSDLEHLLRSDGPARDRLRRAFIRLGNASETEFDVLRLIIRESLGSSRRLRQILGRLNSGHVPLVVETLKDGVRQGEFDRAIPIPLLFLAALGVGALPQVLRRASRPLPIMSLLPDAETLAAWSVESLSRAVGPAHAKRPRSARASARPRISKKSGNR
jgi:TetR/AcrR family transcriptional regulator